MKESKTSRYKGKTESQIMVVAGVRKWIRRKTRQISGSFDRVTEDNFIPVDDLKEFDLLITEDSHKPVCVANGHVKQGKHKTKLLLKRLSPKARAGDSFELLRTTLISGSKVVSDESTAILDRQEVEVYTKMR